MDLKHFADTKFLENDEKSRKLQNIVPAKFNTFKVILLNSISKSFRKGWGWGTYSNGDVIKNGSLINDYS